METNEDGIIRLLAGSRSIGALTGAGISTLCGIPDFRGPQGLYKHPDAERIFSIDWFHRDPSIYYRGCRELVYGLANYAPGPVHSALKRLEDAGKLRGIATQNIDMLHQKAGSSNVWEVHGSPLLHHCTSCGEKATFEEICAMLDGKPADYVPRCKKCGAPYKPDITFFGEALPEEAFRNAQALALQSDLFLVLGTSLTVFPAAGLPRLALQNGAKLLIVNAQPTPLDGYAAATFPDLSRFADLLNAACG